jgi:hypothetical protein
VTGREYATLDHAIMPVRAALPGAESITINPETTMPS